MNSTSIEKRGGIDVRVTHPVNVGAIGNIIVFVFGQDVAPKFSLQLRGEGGIQSAIETRRRTAQLLKQQARVRRYGVRARGKYGVVPIDAEQQARVGVENDDASVHCRRRFAF